MTKADEMLKLLEEGRKYHVYKFKTPWADIPDELTSDSSAGLKEFMPYLTDMGIKELDLDSDPSYMLKALGVANTKSPVMIMDIGPGEWSISLFKEPAYILKEA